MLSELFLFNSNHMQNTFTFYICLHAAIIVCNMNVFVSFYLFMVYIPECKQQLRTMK